MDEPIEVRVIVDEFRNHVPIWFSDRTFDDETLMPVSPTLLEEFRAWNRLWSELVDSDAPLVAFSEHSRVGLVLSRQLADELGDAYAVVFHAFGARGRDWVRVEADT